MFPFVISFLAGISTVLGSFILLYGCNNYKVIGVSFSFASGVMTAVSIIDLIPSSITGFNILYYPLFSFLLFLVFINFGIILELFIGKLFPVSDKNVNNKIYRTGIISMFVIILHNIPEGIATYLTTSNDGRLGVILAIAIALHNIPEGISISVPIYFSTSSFFRAFLYTLLSGMSEFFGSFIAFVFFSNIGININWFLSALYSIIAGIMLALVFFELIPQALSFIKRKALFLWFALGFIFMFFVHIIMQ